MVKINGKHFLDAVNLHYSTWMIGWYFGGLLALLNCRNGKYNFFFSFANDINDDEILRVTSLRPIAYVCGSQFSRKLNFLYRFLARWPWHPSPNIVTLAWSSMPRSNVGYETSTSLLTNIFKQKLFSCLFRV